ncbi:pentatricopeptide repeat-containing protein At5g06540-like [Arachis stenosperma]|uniref:pentatricopeptide repeat-containing protein At5g06540-like n=1 Tax=Arachis stenosperma TaxID=217475 RepID=UPI0025ABF697|nr:pentatricopeptide repeat-containing protein At5g06540-like [Arachis stenosperma]
MSSCSIKKCLKVLEKCKCKSMNQLKQAHAQFFPNGLQHNTFALSRLLALSSHHHGTLAYSFRIFQHIHNPTLCIFNTILNAFFINGNSKGTIHLFIDMVRRRLNPDHYTLPCVLKACTSLGSVSLGEIVHGYGSKLGLLCDVFVGNSLIALYSACGDPVAARKVFDEMPNLNAVSWTMMIAGYAKVGDIDSARLFFDEAPERDMGIWGAMISGYVKNNCFNEGLHLFRLIQSTDEVPDESILVSILSSCAHLGALDIGIWVHRYLNEARITFSIRLSTSLLDMYAKCGHLVMAKRLFDSMKERDVVCWNAMIFGMAMHGDGISALQLFLDMEKAGIKLDDLTFIAIFTACSYSGMVLEGLKLLDKMFNVHKIEPKIEHYGCLVDLLSRAGLFKEAMVMIRRIRDSGSGTSEEALSWRAFLSACCNHGQTKFAELAAAKLLKLENHSGVYVLLSNLYATTGKYSETRRVRDMMKNKGSEKAPGCSSVEIDGVISEFIAGEKTHLQMHEIHSVLKKMHMQLD